jgi:patatin-like phospholipase/acyl hydrolase
MDTYPIIAFNGGGIRGLLSSQILLRLVQYRSTLLGNTSMFAGTSAGAGIAADVGNGATVDQNWQDLQKKIALEGYKDPGTAADAPAYSNTSWISHLTSLYGSTMLSAFPKPIVLTGFQVTSGASWAPVLFNNVLAGAPPVTVVDAVVASGTMPGMFGTYEASTSQYYVDGGFVDHDPSMAAIAVAVQSGVALEDIVLIDIGTGLMPQSFPSDLDTTQWGAAQWQSYSSPATYPNLLVNGTAAPVLNLSLNGTFAGTTAMLAGMLLGDRFVSINPPLTSFIGENDISAVDALIAAGNSVSLSAAEHLIHGYWPT